MTPLPFELIVIGGGPAGTSGANVAAAFGKRVALVEREERLGGAGLNTGTIPSKALRESALVLSGARSRKLLGIDISLRGETRLTDFTHHERRVSTEESKQARSKLVDLNVEVIRGRAAFQDPHTMIVVQPDGNQLTLRGDIILIATGSSPARPPEFPFEHPRVHDSNELLDITCLPKVLAVVGAGVIGAEYASTFAALGVEVHLIDGRDALFSFLDQELSTALQQALAAGGI